MKELTVAKLKAGFSDVIDDVIAGEEYTVLRGRNQQKVARLVPYSESTTRTPQNIQRKRILGRDAGKITIMPDFDSLPEDILSSFGIE